MLTSDLSINLLAKPDWLQQDSVAGQDFNRMSPVVRGGDQRERPRSDGSSSLPQTVDVMEMQMSSTEFKNV